ncbi:MAG: AEC family transporter [Oscillospiraceae bacterium]
MNSLSLAFSVVCPLFLMMALGYFLRKINMFTQSFLQQLNNLCFKVFLPIILFVNVYESDFSLSFNPKLVAFAVISVVVIVLVLMLIVPSFEKNNRRRGVLVQGIFRSNFILFGLPMAASLFGEENTGTTAILIAFIVPLFNLLSVVALERFRGGKLDIKRMAIGVITNPLILGALAAFVFVITGIKLPNIIEGTVRDIAKIATPLSLIVLGGSFAFSGLRSNFKSLMIGVCGKLIIMPFCLLTISVAIGYRGTDLVALLAMFASPTAVSSFTMAQQMDADDELAGQIVVVSSIGAVISVFFWISILSQLGFLV